MHAILTVAFPVFALVGIGWLGGRLAQSMAFLSTPETDALYSGEAISRASAARICSRKVATEAGMPAASTSPS